MSEGDEFIREGGMIAFVLDRRRVRFDIHQLLAEAAGFKLQFQTVERSSLGAESTAR